MQQPDNSLFHLNKKLSTRHYIKQFKAVKKKRILSFPVGGTAEAEVYCRIIEFAGASEGGSDPSFIVEIRAASANL
ncbi:MAG TPA: hypothetical protein PKV35_11055, partial [bacterium]|nr:hypothetical protein [bacterium]